MTNPTDKHDPNNNPDCRWTYSLPSPPCTCKPDVEAIKAELAELNDNRGLMTTKDYDDFYRDHFHDLLAAYDQQAVEIDHLRVKLARCHRYAHCTPAVCNLDGECYPPEILLTPAELEQANGRRIKNG